MTMAENEFPGQEDTAASSSGGSSLREKRYSFYGAFNHSVDAKGRMIVPQAFRERLGESIVIGVNMAQNAIAIYPEEVWQRKVDMLTELAEADVSAEEYLERFAMLSFDNVAFDTQGRVLLPAALRELFMKDAMGVQVSGARDYVRVVSAAQAAGEHERFRQEHPDVLRDISRIQSRIRQAGENERG